MFDETKTDIYLLVLLCVTWIDVKGNPTTSNRKNVSIITNFSLGMLKIKYSRNSTANTNTS